MAELNNDAMIMIHNVNNTIFLNLLHWGDVSWPGLLVVSISLGHLTVESRIGQSGVNINTPELCLQNQVAAIASWAAVNLQQHPLSRPIHQIGKKRNDAFFDVAVDSSFVIHPFSFISIVAGKILSSSTPNCLHDMHQKINSDPLPFCLSHTSWELPVRQHAFPQCVATKKPSAHQLGLGNRPIRQQKVHHHFAPIKQNLRLVDVDDLPKHCLIGNQLVTSNSNGGGGGGGSGCTGEATAWPSLPPPLSAGGAEIYCAASLSSAWLAA